MTTRLVRCVMLIATIVGSVIVAACGGSADNERLQAAVDSLTKQRDSTIARMDSAGVVHADSVKLDSTARRE